MASSVTMLSFNLSRCTLSPPSSSIRPSRCSSSSIQLLTPFNKVHNSLRLSSTNSISGSTSLLLLPNNKLLSTTLNPPSQTNPQSLTVFAHKGYKMKTHKASAKRFRVTGRGKIVRRRAGKQHLLAKKNTKRKLRLSKMIQVNRSDYDNVISCLPYMKVNRKAV